MDGAIECNHMCDPFEAEWQCVCLEMHHIVDATMSTDGDCAMLGVNKFYFNVNSNNETFQLHDKQLTLLARKNPMFSYEVNKWPVTSPLLDNDHLKRIPNVGYATIFNKMLPKFVTWDADEVISITNNNLKHKMTEQQKNKLEESICLHRLARVLNEKTNQGQQTMLTQSMTQNRVF